jgi:hypothetical protein
LIIIFTLKISIITTTQETAYPMTPFMLLALIEFENNPNPNHHNHPNHHNLPNHDAFAELAEIRQQSDAPTLILMLVLAFIFILGILFGERDNFNL